MAEKNGRVLKISMTIMAILATIIITIFGYAISRVDKNTDSITELRANYVSKDDFEKRMDRVDDKLDRLLEKRR